MSKADFVAIVESMLDSPLTSWDDIVNHVQEKHETTLEDGVLSITVEDRAAIRLRPIDVYEAPWIEVIAVLVEALRHVPPAPILSRNFEIPVGTIGMLDGSLLLRQLLPIGGVRAADLDEVLNVMSQTIAEGASLSG